MSDSPVLNTGFAKVGRELLGRLAPDSGATACVGWFHPSGGSSDDYGYCIYPGGDDYGRSVMAQAVREFDPTVIIGLGDFWMLAWWLDAEFLRAKEIIFHIPVDGTLVHPLLKRVVESGHTIVATSKFSQAVIKNCSNQVDLEVIPHGVDTAIFKPPADRKRLKATTYLPLANARHLRISLENKFVVGCVARNQPRKQFPVLIKAFSIFAADKPHAVLCLHTCPLDAGWDIPALLDQYGIADKTVMPEGITAFSGVGEQELCDLYNCLDIFALPTLGEGFCLPILEAMSCGVPVAATECSSVTELVQGRGELIRSQESITTGRFNVEYPVPDVDHLVEVLNKLYESPELRTEYARKGRELAETMTWDRCAEQWEKLLDNVTHVGGGKGLRASPAGSALWRKGPVRIERFREAVAARRRGAIPPLPEVQQNESLQVVWRSPTLDASGYGDASRSFFLPLSRRVCHLRLDDMDWMPQKVPLGQHERALIARLQETVLKPPYLEIVNNQPDLFRRSELASYRIGRTMFELSSLPPFWVEECNAMDEVWVPSTFCRNLFVESGVVQEKLRLIPDAVDIRTFSAHRENQKSREGDDRVRFLAVMAFIRRKGWDTLLEAYAREFTNGEPVELVIKTSYPGRPLTEVADWVLQFLRGLRIPEARIAPIVLLEDRALSREQMADLCRGADVLVAPSRGEGYGRPLVEALSCGVPVITTGWGGHTDFVTDDNGWLLDYELTRIQQDAALTGPIDNPLFEGKTWAEPDLEHLRQCMRQAIAEPALRKHKGDRGPSAAAVYDQERIADAVMARLCEIEAHHEPTGRSCRISSVQDGRTERCVMMTSPHERCGIREYTLQLMKGGLGNSMSLLSCPESFRSFGVEADLLHIQYHPSYVDTHQLALHPPKGKLVATAHELYQFETISHLFDAITVHNARDYERVLGMPRKQNAAVMVLPHGCCEPAADHFTPVSRSDPVIAFHGFAGPGKGVKELIHSFSQFLGFYPRSRLLIVSTLNAFFYTQGQLYLEQCREVVHQLGVEDQVEFVTEFLAMADVVQLLHEQADMVVFPYLANNDSGTSGAVRVAMASGRPALVSDVGLFQDVTEEVARFPLGQMPYLADILRAVWEDETLQRKVVNCALERVKRESWEDAARQMMRIYSFLTAR